jgi:predicted GNAT family acetyltransferase
MEGTTGDPFVPRGADGRSSNAAQKNGINAKVLAMVVVQIAQASEKVVLLCSLNELKEPPSKSRTQKYL